MTQRLITIKGIFKNAVLAVVIVNLLNVVFALLKDIAVAGYLGTTASADQFFMALFIPDMLGNNLLAVSASVAAVPLLAIQSNPKDLKRIYKTIGKMVMILAFIVTLLMLLISILLIDVLNTRFDPSTIINIRYLLWMMLPAVVFYPLITLRMAYLQVESHPALAGSSSVLTNGLMLIWVVCLILSGKTQESGVFWLAISIPINVIISASYLRLLMVKSDRDKTIHLIGEIYKNEYPVEAVSVEKSFYSRFLPYLFMVFMTQGIFYAERIIASFLETGSIAALNYANRLSQFPVLVFSVSIALVALPELSRLNAVYSMEVLGTHYQRALRLIFIISVPLSIGLSLLSEPLVTLLFEHNAFDAHSVMLSVSVLSWYGLSVIGQGLLVLNIRVLVVIKKTIKPLMLLMVALILNVILDCYLVNWLGIKGIGIGAFIGSIISATLMSGLILIRLKRSLLKEITYVFKVILANVPVVILAVVFKNIWAYYSFHFSWIAQLLFGICSGVLICMSSYGIVNYLDLIPKKSTEEDHHE